jgi:hypothetical protein
MEYCKHGQDSMDINDEPWEWCARYVPVAFDLFTNCKSLFYSTAIHEASHAVLNEHFGYRVKSVQANGKTGVTEIEPAKQDPAHVIVIAHAGYIGSLQVVNNRYAYADANDDRGTINSVFDAEKMEIKQVRELYRMCEELVEQNWKKIQAVANALAKKGILSGDEVRAIIRDE